MKPVRKIPPKCKTCRFFDADSNTADSSGECRRKAPMPRVVIRTERQQARWDASSTYHWEVYWPCVGPHDWCGEWQGKGGK